MKAPTGKRHTDVDGVYAAKEWSRIEATKESTTKKKREKKIYPQNPHYTGHGDPQDARLPGPFSKIPINFGFLT